MIAKIQELKGSTKIVEVPQKLWKVQKSVFAANETLKKHLHLFVPLWCHRSTASACLILEKPCVENEKMIFTLVDPA